MSCNFYARPAGACETRCDNWVHLGVSNSGWAFIFQAFPDAEIDGPDAVTWPVTDYASWLKLLDLGEIYDEYGHQVSKDELVAHIEARRDGRSQLSRDDFRDDLGNVFVKGWFS
jgi:hypothetical protein